MVVIGVLPQVMSAGSPPFMIVSTAVLEEVQVTAGVTSSVPATLGTSTLAVKPLPVRVPLKGTEPLSGMILKELAMELSTQTLAVAVCGLKA